MHFRIRKNVVQLVRTEYNPETQRPKTTVVGKMPLSNPVITQKLAELLSADELEETKAWINHINRITLLQEEIAALTLADTLNLANRWFKRQGESEAALAAAADLGHELNAIRKTLKAINPVS